uniref:Uncharacterized protein n=1 Tax=Magallana gigas TaxID=29159 RepID=K1QLZ6_MAGGI
MTSQEIYVSNLTDIKNIWKDTMDKKKSVSLRIEGIKEPFLNKLEEILNKSETLSKIAKEKQAQYEDISVSSKKSEETKRTAEIFTDLLTKMSEIRNNRVETRNVLSFNADPCAKIQTSASRLRTNIADLRKKIQKAKRIASSLPASVVMNGKESLPVTVTSITSNSSPFSAFGFCLKPDKESMAIATLQNPSFSRWVVELEDRKPKISYFNAKGERKGQLKSQTEVELEKWIDIKIFKYGSSILLNRTDLETSTSVVEAKAVLGLPFVAEQPHMANVGFAEALQVLVSIMDCRLHVEARINRGTTVVRSNSTNYCNGRQQFVKAWFKCVKFVDKSKQIVLEKGRNGQILSVAITRDSMGRAFNYKTKNFDIDVFVDGNGFEVVDNKEDERYPLAFPSNLNSHWLVLSVSDKDKK